MFNEKYKKQIRDLKDALRERDRNIRRLTKDINDQVEFAKRLKNELIQERERGPAVSNVVLKTADLLQPDDILVSSDGVSFWENGLAGDCHVLLLSRDLVMVKL